MTYELRWGIIGAGGISTTFVEDLKRDPAERGTSDVTHRVVAVAARDIERAKAFISEIVEQSSGAVAAYGNYEAICRDENVDCIYIGTTHVHHFAQAKLALLAGKHVLIEKPITTTAKDARELIDLARSKGVFLMEAVWTRYQPLVREIEDKVKSGAIGQVKRVIADLAFFTEYESVSLTNRMIAPELAGGALLDLGSYPLLWPLMLISDQPPSSVTGSMQLTNLKGLSTQVDAQTVFVLNWDELRAQAILSVSIDSNTSPSHGVQIQGTLGELTVSHPNFRPEAYSIHLSSSPDFHSETFSGKIGAARGMHWMADEVARCIRDGKLGSDRMPMETSLLQMEIFDKVREQGGYILYQA